MGEARFVLVFIHYSLSRVYQIGAASKELLSFSPRSFEMHVLHLQTCSIYY
jgi:hypothetical protein